MAYPVYSQAPLEFDVNNHEHTYNGVKYNIWVSIAYTPADENDQPYDWAWRDTVVIRHVDDIGRFRSAGNVGIELWDSMPRERVYDQLCKQLERSLRRELDEG